MSIFCLTLLSTFLFVIGASTEATMSALCIISGYTVTTNFCLQRLFCFTVSFRQGYVQRTKNTELASYIAALNSPS